MIRRHDRYIVKSFWGTFVAVLLFISVIVLVMELSDRADRLARYWHDIKKAGYDPLALIVRYYATFFPFVWTQLIPICAPVAACMCLTRLSRRGELTPLLVSGISMRRAVLPIVLSSVVIAGVLIVMQVVLVPSLSRENMRMQRLLGKQNPHRSANIAPYHDSGGHRLSMGAYNPIESRMENVFLTQWGKDGYDAIRTYPSLEWNQERKGWFAPFGGTLIPRRDDAPGSVRRPIEKGARAPLNDSRRLMEISLTRAGRLGVSFDEVDALIEANPNDTRYRLMRHQLWTQPLSVIVLLLLALPFCTHVGRRKSSALPGILNAMGVAALYFGAGYVASLLARTLGLNPVVMAWLPTVIFGSLGIAFYVSLDG